MEQQRFAQRPSQHPPPRAASAQQHRTPPGQAVLSTAASDGVDLLWRFQLRKENVVLLDKLESSQKAIEACSVANDQHNKEITEQVAALDAKILKFEDDAKKNSQLQESLIEEISTLKRKLETFLEKSTLELTPYAPTSPPVNGAPAADRSNVSKPTFLHAQTFPNHISSPAIHSKPVLQQPATPTKHHENEPLIPGVFPRPVETPASQATTASHSSSDYSNPPSTLPVRPVLAQSKKVASITTAPASTRNARSRHDLAIRSTDAGRQKAVPPANKLRLKQSWNEGFQHYYIKSNNIFQRMPTESQEVQREFVASFINGLNSTEYQGLLKRELMKKHPARARPGGIMEILCRWSDVEDALLRLGLIKYVGQSAAGVAMGRPLQKRGH